MGRISAGKAQATFTIYCFSGYVCFGLAVEVEEVRY